MLLERYETSGLLFNRNFQESAPPAYNAYRGELVLVEGELADAAGRRKPPTAVVRDAVVLASDGGLQLVGGVLNDIRELPLFADRFAADLASDAMVFLFVANAHTSAKVTIGTHSYWVIALAEGMVWTELCDMVALEKGDFKGQSAGEKIVTLYQALLRYRPAFAEQALDTMLANATQTKRGTRGAL